MPKPILIVCCLALSACAGGGGLFGGADTQRGTPAPSTLDTGSLGVYFDTMQALIEGDAGLQAEIFEQAAQAAALAPTSTNRLRLALVLAMPGHAAADPREAQRQLSQLLAAGDMLLPEERVLAQIHLQEVEERLILDTAAEQQQERTAAELAQLNAENTEQLETTRAENKRLREALEDAQSKLEAITSIERSIRERDGATDVP